MTPAEREALELAAQKASRGPYTCLEFEHADYGTGKWHGDGSWFVMEGGNCENIADEMTENNAKYYAAASPEVILHLLSLISTLELTLSNATRVGVVQIERISALEVEKDSWLNAAMVAQEALESIKHSMYCMPASQYSMMHQGIRRVQELWGPELDRRRAAPPPEPIPEEK